MLIQVYTVYYTVHVCILERLTFIAGETQH